MGRYPLAALKPADGPSRCCGGWTFPSVEFGSSGWRFSVPPQAVLVPLAGPQYSYIVLDLGPSWLSAGQKSIGEPFHC